ncbi:major facilitator superfamily domain-containing protein [Gongronella butleri]|nr:major facilitator superfamily domain-containing protein [Gongronella butleri]
MAKTEFKDDSVAEHIEKTEMSSVGEEHSDNGQITAAVQKSPAEQKLVKKINWTVLPFIWFIVFIQFADKSALSGAAVLGMLEETGTSPTQYSLLGSIFFVGYIAYQLPNSFIIQRLPISKYLGTLLVFWGISVACTALCHTFGQLAACRILLGLFEAGTYPCLFILVNAMYRRQEQSAIYGFLYMSNGSGTIISALITYGIVNMKDTHGISLWRWNYIIFGVMTVLTGIVTFFFMPDIPLSRWFRLTEDEKEIVEQRIQDNSVVRNREVKVYQYWECLKEPRFYLIGLATFANHLSNGGLVVFSTPFVKTLGFSSVDSILLQMPSAAVSVLFCFVGVFIHRKTNSYVIAAAVCSGIAMIGCILLVCLPHSTIKLLGYYPSWACSGSYVMLLTMVASNVSGYSKKLFYNAMVMIMYTLGNFAGPLIMLSYEAPVYRTGMITFAAGNLTVFLCIATTSYLASRTNKERLRNGPVGETDAHLNLTDREDPNFIYKL